MFGRWFGRRASRAVPVEDRVWSDAPACARGLRLQATRVLREGGAVLLLARLPSDREDLARDLAAFTPLVGSDRFATCDLAGHLGGAGALGIASVGDLRPATTPSFAGNRAPLEIHIQGRGLRRDEDRRLIAALAAWAPARVVFHDSLDGPLLRPHARALHPLLRQLGWSDGEPVSSHSLTRAIERAQQAG